MNATNASTDSAHKDPVVGLDLNKFVTEMRQLNDNPEYRMVIDVYASGGPSLGGEITLDEFESMLARNVVSMRSPEYWVFSDFSGS